MAPGLDLEPDLQSHSQIFRWLCRITYANFAVWLYSVEHAVYEIENARCLMNALWYALRSLYFFGLIFVVPIAIIAYFNLDRDLSVSIPVMVCSVGYFLLGYIVCSWMPSRLASRLERRVSLYKSKGFMPDKEITSVLYNRYVGFDSRQQMALYIDVNDGTERQIPFNQIDSWELDEERNRPALIRLLTRMPQLPVIGLRIDRAKSGEWKSNLGVIFG